MNKDSSYYTQGIRRKLSAFVFKNGLIKNKGQVALIKEIVLDIKYPVHAKFPKEYLALAYLNDTFIKSLNFEDEIAVSEKDGESNPLTPAIYALHCYNSNKIGVFKLHVEYLMKLMKKDGEQCYWEYHNDLIRFQIPAPWTSGISQAVIASLMLRMYHETKEEKYFDIAKGAILYCLDKKNKLRLDMSVGFWVEEYPSEIGKGVLNGFLFFLIALAELSSFNLFKDELNEGIKCLLARIPFYHKGIYLKYASNIPDLCNPWYDKIHYHQLNAMFGLTNENVFLKLKEYWTNTSSTNFKIS